MKAVNELSVQEAKAELEYLANEISKADSAYYQNDAPYLTDAEYDRLKHRNLDIESRFPELVRPDSPSKRIGASIKQGFNKVSHTFPMLSLGDVFSIEVKNGQDSSSVVTIDEEGFCSTTYFSQKDLEVKTNSSLTQKYSSSNKQ